MSARFSTAQMSMAVSQRDAKRMPFSMPAMQAMCAMCTASAASATSTFIIRTDVFTSVSLFAVLLSVLLLVSLVVLISLLLTCLTGLPRLESLVGLITGLATNATRGD